MAYEGQISGVGDRPPGRPLRGAAIRFMQRRSAEELAERRAAAVAAIREVAELEIVNGGGTGSLELTAAEERRHRGDSRLRLLRTCPVRPLQPLQPHPGGRLRPADRAPARPIGSRRRWAAATSPRAAATPAGCRSPGCPPGLHLDAEEGAGEVQTPLLGAAAEELRVGDRVYMRHAKAGELCERFDSLHLVEGGEIVDVVPTYRGDGKAFL